MTHTDEISAIKDKITEAFVENAVFDGLDWHAVLLAAEQAGYQKEMAVAVFPEKLESVMVHFSGMTDRQMLSALADVDTEDMRIRDRITLAVQKRLEILAPHKEAVKLMAVYWNVPPRQFLASRLVWRTADHIWNWAGDTSKDYNFYTKRALLSAVLTSTMIAWMGEDGDDLEIPFAFLDRRIENVMQFGKILGRIKK